jgi:hypothetical protein
MKLIIVTMRRCGHVQFEPTEVSGIEEAVKVGIEQKKEICDHCANTLAVPYFLTHDKEATA